MEDEAKGVRELAMMSSPLGQGIGNTTCTANRLCPTHLLCRHAASFSPPGIAPPTRYATPPPRYTITVAPSILHPKDGGDPDDPSQNRQITSFSEGIGSRKATQSVCDLLVGSVLPALLAGGHFSCPSPSSVPLRAKGPDWARLPELPE